MIIEKLLPKELDDAVYKLLMSSRLPWFWNAENIIPKTPDKDLFQMTHVFYLYRKVHSPYYNLLTMVAGYFAERTGIKIKRIVRIKANLLPNINHDEESLKNLIHTDMDKKNTKNFV